MSNNKQSSVEFFLYEMFSLLGEFENKALPSYKIMDLFEQAKAMHKEEIIDAHERGQSDEKDYWNIGDKVGVRFMVKSNEYYKEKFNQ